jgi:hypothetical protein
MMAAMHVNAESLNLRSATLVKPETLLVSLPFGHAVDVDGDADRPGWKAVSTHYLGKSWVGFVSGQFLRNALSPAKEKLIAMGAVEWDRFKRGAGKEQTSPFNGFVGEMWKNLGMNLTGKDTGVPWSAACISFIHKNAGYTRFKQAAAHAIYIHDAIASRESVNVDRDYWGFRTTEHAPQLGDLVCRKRSNAKIDYEFASKNFEFQSHTDIVIAVGKDSVSAVGGNVSNSVSTTRYKLLPNGKLDPQGGRVFAVLRNNN